MTTEAALRIGDVAARVGVSTRTLRYYEELGLLTPSGYTSGGERRYRAADLVRLQRIVELKELLGMNLEEIRGLLESEGRLDELRTAYRAQRDTPTRAAEESRRAILVEALALRTALVERLDAKLARLGAFRAEAAEARDRCRALLAELAVRAPSR